MSFGLNKLCGEIEKSLQLTLIIIIVVQAPGLDVVLGELGVGEEHHGVREQLHVALRELLELEVHAADLSVEGVVVEQVGAVELLVVGLVHSQQVFLAFENLNLNKTGPKQFKIEQPSVKSREQDEMINYYA